MKLITLILTSFFLLTFAQQNLFSEIQGKADIGPAYVHIDVLNKGITTHRMDLAAIKADATVLLYKGFCVKPTLLYGFGNGYICSPGIGVGFVIPAYQDIYITPLVGCSYTYLRTKIDLQTPFITLEKVREKFRSISPYIGFDFSIKFWDCWRLCASYQYSWSRTHTTIGHLIKDKSHTEGSNYGAMIERDLNDKWSLNLGAAYNTSLSKEKHGLRGYGIKAGITHWF